MRFSSRFVSDLCRIHNFILSKIKTFQTVINMKALSSRDDHSIFNHLFLSYVTIRNNSAFCSFHRAFVQHSNLPDCDNLRQVATTSSVGSVSDYFSSLYFHTHFFINDFILGVRS